MPRDLTIASAGFTGKSRRDSRIRAGMQLADAAAQGPMLDREKVVAVLKHRFPGAATAQVAAATNAIIGLGDEWVELPSLFANGHGDRPAPCGASCYLVEAARRGASFRVFKRVEDDN